MLRLFNWIGTRFSVGAAWSFLSWGLPLAALLVGAAGGAYAAWHLGRAPLRTENAALREAHTEAARLAQQAAARRLQAAQARSDALGTALGQSITANETLSQEKTHALHLEATGRVCLSDGALRVLNGAPGIRVAGLGGVPAPEPAAAAAGGAAAPDTDTTAPEGTPGRVATDEDIGAWSIGAGAAYETCRARLDALIDWHTPQEPAHER